MNKNRNVVMIGLPNTGKTTFLAALWFVVNNQDEVSSEFKLDELHGDIEYLNEIQKCWLSFQRVERTKRTAEVITCMKLIDQSSNSTISLNIPDLSGERFRQQFEDRIFDEDYAKMAVEADGLLLFTHSGKIKTPIQISDAEPVVEIFSDDEEIGTLESGINNKLNWEPLLVPTQIKLVDLLQIFLSITKRDHALRVSLILSAWDLFSERDFTPRHFVKSRLPLLNQYFVANEDILSTKIFGVSAQGGSLETEQECIDLSEKFYNPAQRVIVQVENSVSNDLTLPLKWILS